MAQHKSTFFLFFLTHLGLGVVFQSCEGKGHQSVVATDHDTVNRAVGKSGLTVNEVYRIKRSSNMKHKSNDLPQRKGSQIPIVAHTGKSRK